MPFPLYRHSSQYLISLAATAYLYSGTRAEHCGDTCFDIISPAVFTDYNETDAITSPQYGSYCSSPFFAATIALCITQYCSEFNTEAVYTGQAKLYCSSLGLTNFAGLTLSDAATAGKIDAVPYTSLNLSTPVTTAFYLDDETWGPFYRTNYLYYHQLGLGEVYGGALIAWIGGFLVLAMLQNAVVKLMTYGVLSQQNFAQNRPSYLMRLFQRFILYPATISKSHLVRPRFLGVTFSIPTRAQTYIIAGYVVLACALCCSSFGNTLFDENVYWPAKTDQFQRYIADRTGIMAISQLPFVFLFAGRNNILLWLTGWSYHTFNVYHKWTSRVMWALAVVHSIVYTVSAVRMADLAEEYTYAYWIWGVIATIISSFMILFAVHNFREVAYEVFLLAHTILAAIFLCAMWWHCNLLGWMQYLYVSIAVWAFDRVVRLLRIVYFNLGFSSLTTIEITGISASTEQILLVKIFPVRKVKVTPGQYLFLHIGAIAPWSAHPFTVLEQDALTGNYLVVARVHKGLTEKLYDQTRGCESKPGREESPEVDVPSRSLTLNAGIDSMYGSSSPVQLYDTVLLIAGGAGIAGCFPYISYIMKHTRRQTKSIRLIWAVRSRVWANWLLPRLEALLRTNTSGIEVCFELYVTSTKNGSTKNGFPEVTSDVKNGSTLLADAVAETTSLLYDNKVTTYATACDPTDDSVVRSYAGRPDLARCLGSTLGDATSSVAVLVCGPAEMSDEMRYLVHHNIEEAKGRLDYFEGNLQW